MYRWLIAALVVLPVGSGCRPHSVAKAGPELAELDQQLELVLEDESQEIIVREQAITDADFARILAAERVASLELYHCAMKGIAGIDRIADLRRLRLEAFPCDDVSAQQISQLRHLTILNLPDAAFTDAGLASIAKLPSLELLRFGSQNVTDEGLACLGNVKTLRFLHLIGVPVSDRGLEAFHGSSQLESFYIDGGLQTDEGIRLLLRANPGLHFHRDQLHLPDDPRSDGH